jgi:hypothetical protein
LDCLQLFSCDLSSSFDPFLFLSSAASMKTNLNNFQKVIPLRKSLTIILHLCSDLKIGTNEYNNSLYKAFLYTNTLFSAMATIIHPVADTLIKKISDIFTDILFTDIFTD